MKQTKHIITMLNSHSVRIIEPGGRIHASVALILRELDAGLSILLIERSSNENDYWSGQTGFPGGRSETADKSSRHTAEREAWMGT